MLRRRLIIQEATDEAIRSAAHIISGGALAAFPTETVYGLGADAFNADAVARIYAVKGRPTDNPLILHVDNIESFLSLTSGLPEYALRLAEAFWPGPLTLVARKHPALPGWVGGHPNGVAETVAVRFPSHPVARAVIAYAGCPVAAPSANKAGRPSPTRAEHVAEDFGGDEIEWLLDGGAVSGGLESTVVDVTGDAPVILRPGAVTAEMIKDSSGVACVSANAMAQASENAADSKNAPRSPGMKYRHYAPRAPMTVVSGGPCAAAAYITGQITAREGTNRQTACVDPTGIVPTRNAETNPARTKRYGVLATLQTLDIYHAGLGAQMIVCTPEGDYPYNPRGASDPLDQLDPDSPPADVFILLMGDRTAPETVARSLYACLRRFDTLDVDVIYAESIPEEGVGKAVMNRMLKAAGGNIV